MTVTFVFQYGIKLRGVHEEQLMDPKHYNEALLTIRRDILRPIRGKQCQNRQHRTSNAHRPDFGENSLMVDPVKNRTEGDLDNLSLLPTFQCTLYSVIIKQRRIVEQRGRVWQIIISK